MVSSPWTCAVDRMRCRERAGTSFSQGDRWKKLISRYIQAMPPIGRMPGPDAHSTLCMSFAENQAINAKVGEAARPSQLAGSLDGWVSEGRFLASMSVVIFEFPVELRRYFSALNLTKMYGLASGGVSNKCDGKQMDSLIVAAARSLAAGDPLAALKRIALREDALALALRGIAMAQLGDLARATELLRSAARAFGAKEPVARARCNLAEAEIALVSRNLGRPTEGLHAARSTLEALGDVSNAAHAGYLEARRLLLIGRLDEAEGILDDLDAGALPVTSRTGYELVAAGIAIRRIHAKPARDALDRAERAAAGVGNAALKAEVDRAVQAFEAPAGRLVARDGERLLQLEEVEALIASDAIIIDACRSVVRTKTATVSLASRPVLSALVRLLGESWPEDASREELLVRAFRAREADESHRARLRVEIGRLREAIRPLAEIHATERGFVLEAHQADEVAVLAPPVEDEHGEVLALLADGEAWSSSAMALALDVSPRTVQRALETLAEKGKAEWFGRGRARRWIATSVPGFPTSLLLPANGVVG